MVWLDGRRTGIGAEGCGTDIGGGTLSRVEPLGDPERDAAPFLTGTVGTGDGTRCDVSELFCAIREGCVRRGFGRPGTGEDLPGRLGGRCAFWPLTSKILGIELLNKTGGNIPPGISKS